MVVGDTAEEQMVEDQADERQIAEEQMVIAQIVEDLNAAVESEVLVATEIPSSYQPTEMDIENIPSSSVVQTLNEIKKENEELKSKQDADKQELKVWMAKQEETTAGLQKTTEEIKGWMVK